MGKQAESFFTSLGNAVSVPAGSRKLSFKYLLPASLGKVICEQHLGSCPVKALEAALARESKLLQERDALIAEQELLRSESDHRLLNGLQMVVSLLSLQSSAALTPDVAIQLSIAANRVATINRVHRWLHANDGTKTVALKKYLEGFCTDFTGLTSSEAGQIMVVEGCELEIPTATAVPLGFIANELITNAVKYGKGRIVVGLNRGPGGRNTLSVSNDGPALPADFDPASSKGLGMRIIRAMVQKIGGEMTFSRREDSQGAHFAIHFA